MTVTVSALPDPPVRSMMFLLTNEPDGGALSDSTGDGIVVTVTCAGIDECPAASSAMAVIVACGEPETSTVVWKVPSDARPAGMPLTCTVMGVSLSLATPFTIT